MTRVLVVATEPVGGVMAGPAIRSLELARVLADHCEVTLAAPPPSEVPDDRIGLLHATQADFDVLHEALRAHDVVVAQQLPAQLLRYVAKLPVRYVADLYNPLVVELLEAIADAGAPREDALVRRFTKVVWAQCAVADFIICASETQRDLWIGGLGLSGLIELGAYRKDRTFRSFVDVVPFGLRDTPPTRGEPVLKGVWPGIDPDDQVLLWGGGIWRWLDAVTPIRAVERLVAEGRRVHLVFLGVGRPGDRTDIPTSAAEAIAFAQQRGLEGRHVHFNPGWVPYEERGRYLLEADLGISAHHEHLETRYSFRTRVLDYLWAGLPMVLTKGDSMAELAERRGLGATVDAEDDAGFAQAVAALLDDVGYREATAARVREEAEAFQWHRAARPLVDFCVDHRERPERDVRTATIALATYGQVPSILADAVRTTGPLGLARRVGRQVGRVLRHGA